jgi:succinate dehydrogenase hydrophobic anchor subunit
MYIFGMILKADYGVNIKNWIVDQATALVMVAIVITMIPIVLKKQWAGLLGLIFVGALAVYFASNPDTLLTIGKTFYDLITAGG